MNEIQPSQEHQQQALDLLRQKARSAHAEGDGVLVNHLSSMALNKILEWKSKSELVVRPIEYRWALILPVYWQLDSYLLDMVKKATPMLGDEQNPERDLALAVISLVSLSEQPLAGYAKQIEAITKYTLSWIPDDPELEDEVLTSLIVELVWYRATLSDLWIRVADRFMEQTPTRISGALSKLKERLKQQTALLFDRQADNKIFNDLLDRDLNLMRDGWEAFFDFSLEELDEILKEMSDRYSFDHFLALQQSQLRQKYSLLWSADDPITLRLSRYDYLVQFRKEVQFDGFRSQRYTENLLELIKADEVAGAHRRFTCFRLGMMRELAALRGWYLGSWFISVSNQYDSNKELFLHSVDEGRLVAAYQMVRLGTLSTAAESDRKSFKKACLVFDEASDIDRKNLLREIINYRPAVQATVLSTLEHFSDAIPEDCIDEVIQFCNDVLDHQFFQRRRGIVGKMGFWAKVIPYSENPVNLCQKLEKVAQCFVKDLSIAYSIEPDFLKIFLAHADIDQAQVISDSLCNYLQLQQDHPSRNDAWVTLYNSIAERKDLGVLFLEKLIETAIDPLQESSARNLSEQSANNLREDEKLKNEAKKIIETQINSVLNRDPNSGVFPAAFYNFLNPLAWNDEDIGIVQGILKAIKSQKVQIDEIAIFFGYLSIIVLNGEVSLAKAILEDFISWLNQLPAGRDIGTGINSPLSTLTITGPNPLDSLMKSITSLAYAMVYKYSDIVNDQIILWLRSYYAFLPDTSAYELLDVIVCLGLKHQKLQIYECAGFINSILARAYKQVESESLESYLTHSILSKVSNWSQIKEGSGILVADTVDPEYRSKIVDLISKYLPLFAMSINPYDRAWVGRVIREWTEAEICPDELWPLVDQLKQDARASVRWQVKDI